MSKVLILGSTGMLGHAVADEFANYDGQVIGTARRAIQGSSIKEIREFDVSTQSLREVTEDLGAGDYVINCIGVIKPYIKDESPSQRENAIRINALFPDELGSIANEQGFKVIQIATDCVFSGQKGLYAESDAHDALDVYGKSKSLGEIPVDSMMHIRVSIIGPEYGRSSSLLEWVRNQPANAEISGYSDHMWNGVPTKHFGRVCRGIVEKNGFIAGTYHLVPADMVSKFELVSQIASVSNREDIVVTERPSGAIVDRTLRTENPEINKKLWSDAGYEKIPTMQQLVSEIFE
jgi:dTDP-4-dehydrorhamnose reductase